MRSLKIRSFSIRYKSTRHNFSFSFLLFWFLFYSFIKSRKILSFKSLDYLWSRFLWWIHKIRYSDVIIIWAWKIFVWRIITITTLSCFLCTYFFVISFIKNNFLLISIFILLFLIFLWSFWATAKLFIKILRSFLYGFSELSRFFKSYSCCFCTFQSDLFGFFFK